MSKKPKRMFRKQNQPPLNPRQKKEVDKIILRNQEIKYFVGGFSASNVTNTAVINGVPFDIPQGDTDSERDGDHLKWLGKVRMNFQMIANGSAKHNTIRLILFQWHPTSLGTPIPVPSSILLSGPTGSVDIMSHYNHDQRQNYKILYDQVFDLVGDYTVDPAAVTTTTVITKHVKVSLAKARKQVQYNAGGLQGTNRLFLIYVSDSALLHPTLALHAKVFFTDS